MSGDVDCSVCLPTYLFSLSALPLPLMASADGVPVDDYTHIGHLSGVPDAAQSGKVC